MHIHCPKCHTCYSVAPTKIGPRGRVVRCSQCSCSWKQEPAEHTPVFEALETELLASVMMSTLLAASGKG